MSLCYKCSKKIFTRNMGHCDECNEHKATSGMKMYCPKCAEKLGKCECCGKGLVELSGTPIQLKVLENGDCLLPLPDEFCDKEGWKENDEIEIIMKDTSIILKKKV